MKTNHKTSWAVLIAAVVLGAAGCDRRDATTTTTPSGSASSPSMGGPGSTGSMSGGNAASVPGSGASR